MYPIFRTEFRSQPVLYTGYERVQCTLYTVYAVFLNKQKEKKLNTEKCKSAHQKINKQKCETEREIETKKRNQAKMFCKQL